MFNSSLLLGHNSSSPCAFLTPIHRNNGPPNYTQHALVPRQYVLLPLFHLFPLIIPHRPENCTKDNYPLVFQDAAVEIRPAEPNLGFIERFLPKLEWSALVSTARALGNDTLPDQMPEDKEQLRSEAFLMALHRVLMETHVEEGKMVCRGCGHVYQISSGIPNMVSRASAVARRA
jgi:multifunctional methyltransferase subunit TRM112